MVGYFLQVHFHFHHYHHYYFQAWLLKVWEAEEKKLMREEVSGEATSRWRLSPPLRLQCWTHARIP